MGCFTLSAFFIPANNFLVNSFFASYHPQNPIDKWSWHPVDLNKKLKP